MEAATEAAGAAVLFVAAMVAGAETGAVAAAPVVATGAFVAAIVGAATVGAPVVGAIVASVPPHAASSAAPALAAAPLRITRRGYLVAIRTRSLSTFAYANAKNVTRQSFTRRLDVRRQLFFADVARVIIADGTRRYNRRRGRKLPGLSLAQLIHDLVNRPDNESGKEDKDHHGDYRCCCHCHGYDLKPPCIQSGAAARAAQE